MADPIVLAATITGFGTLGAAGLAALGNRRLRQEIRTNNGRRPGEYLEKIADVAEGQLLLSDQLAELGDKFEQHRIDDSLHFTLLHRRIDRLSSGTKTPPK